ncbi:MAG: transglycosylase SLT domain-containing protein [Muribaculaceae bacterium]|nr:transglycosylase SLT domain-containing protein [Muribaculaceae bacterium]
MMKKFVLSLFISLNVVSASALSINDLRNTIQDNNIVPPNSFETSIEEMQNNWYLQNYTELAEPKESSKGITTPTDELYIQRLQRLQNEMGFTIEMPYNNVVKSYIEMYTSNRRKPLVEKMLGMWLYYEPIFEEALSKEDMPLELKYLPIIESALNPNAVSPAGAAGLWQFILSTGRGMGLEVNSLIDERRDTYKASQKAAEFLKSLYKTYGDWSLAIAAYNCGPGNVNKAIRRSGGGKKDYWEIYNYLPKETRGYVPAFIAAAYVMNYHNEHGISSALAKKPILTDTVWVKQRLNFKQISDVIDLEVEALETLNPQYRKNIIPGSYNKPYVLILPSKQVYSYLMSENTISLHDAEEYALRKTAEPGVIRNEQNSDLTDGELPQTVNEVAQNTKNVSTDDNVGYTSKEEVIIHEVKSGETLKSIANKYGTNTSRIKKDNNLTSNVVSRGQSLKITTYKKVLTDNESLAQNDGNSSLSSTVAPPAPKKKERQYEPVPYPKKKQSSDYSNASSSKVKSKDNYTGSTYKTDKRRSRSYSKSQKSTSSKNSSVKSKSKKSTKESKATKSSSSKKKSTAKKSSSSSKKKTATSKSTKSSSKKSTAKKSTSSSKKSTSKASSSKKKSSTSSKSKKSSSKKSKKK